MKNLKLVLAAVLILTVIGGLWYRNGQRGGAECEKTEFLFDTECTVRAYGKRAEEAVDAVFSELANLDGITDMYDSGSQVSQINSAAAGETVKVDMAVVNMISTAQQVCRDSGGAFDITVAPVTRLWKFDGGEPSVPDPSAIRDALAAVGTENFSVDLKDFTVTKLANGAAIDLGGVVKGYAADKAAQILKSFEVDGAIADLGGNVMCVGKNPKTKNGKWRIGLQKPFAPTGEYDRVIELSSGAAVTSGTYQRGFELDGRRYHHILDPQNGYPSEKSYDGVTVTAERALIADCLSTACFVLGEEKGRELAEKYGADIYYVFK